ncbi:MAG: putative basic amino acid antiporter YfcC [Caldithrix sp.]|nr:putative basic amino acid antiporter YfcC [Caldithrix sp.]
MALKDKKIKVPNTLVLIFSIMVLVAILTWFVPGGHYEREMVDGRELLQPDSYNQRSNIPQGLSALLQAPIKGFVDAARIIAFILIVGGAFVVIQKTGAVDALIQKIARAHQHSKFLQTLLIPLIMTVFSLFGSIFGMSEEVIPFILIFVPLAISLGYDSIVGVAMPFIGAGVGFAGAFLNPFTIGIAQGIADLPPFSGAGYRIICWLVVTTVAIVFVMVYAARIRREPQKSLTYDIDQYWRDHVQENHDDNAGMKLSKSHLTILSIFGLAIIMLIVGVTVFKWYINAISALFFGTAIIIGLVSHLSLDELAESFVSGARDLVGVAFIIAFARSILIIASDGQIIDSILHGLSGLVSGAHPVLAAQLMFLVQSVINVFVPSGSGQAALIMPIMAPLGDLLEVTRQTAVLAFQMGDGFTNMIIPTSGVTMGVLGVARIPYEKWFRWMISLQIIFFVLALLLLIPPVLMQWGPF